MGSGISSGQVLKVTFVLKFKQNSGINAFWLSDAM